ncbi:hypothetical protein [Lacisediminihabitans profunda]|uniref:Uncharacterized protein n=1 Tax=Lacisediminihabitans profunda TaxID=2594790 RepID=A0A5C8UMX7_9MICO|nr:hypothetical protein [Lacisediminihabitans profunda]TXN29772.1 hypothetical protein FVP33_11525 [Lacisediminihabitans profunda]
MSEQRRKDTPPESSEAEVEHPAPTVSTIKELYSHAFSCAKPDCREWLYRQDGDSVEPVLNSRVAHIHARSPGGPRWKPGMSAEENRSSGNLLLLCIPHSYEVDEHSERYSAEMLNQWRVDQREEHDRLRKAWPLSDEEARLVGNRSFDTPALVSPVLADIARAAERLATSAESSRPAIVAEAGAWRAMWDRVRASTTVWDGDGERLYVEPSRMETTRYREALLAALATANAALEPLVQDLKAEAAVARAAVPRSIPWSDWLARSAENVMTAASTWPGPPPAVDDDGLSDAVAELRESAGALAAVLRGDPAMAPPAVPQSKPSDPTPTVEDDPLREHQELLERARPFARVNHRPYEPDLRARLVVAARNASTIPPVVNASGIDLRATAALTAAVTRNAERAQLEGLIDQDRARRPLCMAVLLLYQLRMVLIEQGHADLGQRAADAIIGEIEATNWSQASAWVGNEHYGRAIFDAWATLASPEEPRGRLAVTLREEPGRIAELTVCCAGWVQHENQQTGEVRYERIYRQLPPWFPVHEIATAAAAAFPYVAPAVDEYDDRPEEIERLLGQVLRLRAASDQTTD